MLIPNQTLSSGSPFQQAQSKASLMPNNPTPDSPTEKSLAPSPGGPTGRLQRSPRRRHTKSQNGCPKEARTAQLVRVGEQASAGKGEGALGRAVARTVGRTIVPPSCTGRFPLALKARGSDREESRPHPPGWEPRRRSRPAHRPQRVPAVRPAPPPSAPAPSRTEPTRAGCSAGSPG